MVTVTSLNYYKAATNHYFHHGLLELLDVFSTRCEKIALPDFSK